MYYTGHCCKQCTRNNFLYISLNWLSLHYNRSKAVSVCVCVNQDGCVQACNTARGNGQFAPNTSLRFSHSQFASLPADHRRPWAASFVPTVQVYKATEHSNRKSGNKSAARNVDSMFPIQLEEDRGAGTRQKWSMGVPRYASVSNQFMQLYQYTSVL